MQHNLCCIQSFRTKKPFVSFRTLGKLRFVLYKRIISDFQLQIDKMRVRLELKKVKIFQSYFYKKSRQVLEDTKKCPKMYLISEFSNK